MGQGQGKEIAFTDEVNLNHFKLLRVVGKGAFGKVRIVERKDTALTFALKYIRKDEVVRSESVRNIIRERRMLEHINHAFICNLRYSFQDIEYMYMVIDLMTGGDLRFHISRKTFTEEAVKFWIAELGCALRYIHKQGIIHRDVKPDNVLLDSEGHVHLADFNVASDYTAGKPLVSKSGTLAYLAPEVYAGTGYGPGADWWSLGVLFYECIYNKRPFDGNNSATLGATICAANPKFPVTSPPVSMVCNHAISSALEPNPSLRMGSASWSSFTDNPFFREIDFEALERKEIEPVFIPSSEKTNFDATYDLEELLLEEAPLEARARRQKPREPLKDDATEKEIREEGLYHLIETQFKPFDYTVAAYNRYALAGDTAPAPVNADSWQTNSKSSSEEPNAVPYPSSTSHHHQQQNQIQTPQRNTSSPRPPADTNTNPNSLSGSPPTIPPISNHRYRTTAAQKAFAASQLLQQQGGSSNATSSPNTYPNPPSPESHPSSYPQQQSQSQSQPQQPRIGRPSRTASATGGLSVVLGETGSWSELAKQDTTLPADAREGLLMGGGGEGAGKGGRGGSGMLGFLSRKRGRGHSPKPAKVMERGVLGKGGVRVVMSG